MLRDGNVESHREKSGTKGTADERRCTQIRKRNLELSACIGGSFCISILRGPLCLRGIFPLDAARWSLIPHYRLFRYLPWPVMKPLLLAAYLLVTAVTQPESESLQLTLQLSSSSISQCDPLVCRVLLENRRDTPFVLANELSSPAGTLRFEIREKDGNWRTLRLLGEGLAHVIGEPLTLEPDACAAMYETAFCHERGYCFPEVGVFQLRAVATQKGWRLASTPIDFTVNRLGEDDHSFRFENFHKLMSVVRLSTGAPPRSDILQEASERLEASELKRHVLWQIKLHELEETPARALDEKFAAIGKLTSKMPGISATPAKVLLAQVCLKQQRRDLALQALADADSRFGEVHVLLTECKQ